METLTRFNNLRYEHFKVNFKGLVFEVKLLDDSATFSNSNNKDLVEEFKVIVTNGEKSISYKFYNSIMEREISSIIKLYNKNLNFSQLKIHLKQKPLKMWGGYDEVRNFKQLTETRIYNLLYSIINSFGSDMDIETDDFKFFCDSFGYDEDSRTAEKIFNASIEFKQKVNTLKLSENQINYLRDIAGREEKPFKEDVLKAIEKAKEI